jgi:hypoxanthine phosphoribosyltransferase
MLEKLISKAEESMKKALNYVNKIDGNKMTYYANYPAYLSEQRRTYKIVVNLDTMKEESRTQLKRWNRNGNYNMYKCIRRLI